ncbi:Oidioi.mRNA.OKI2018_I69.XSR.g14526.t1.cds [Oikopleura dioica]|uniref:Oidioi.mRNA.OKI2018_I69.XSR.g14526.t1.cds n=1 Tax=Oikopleura dioica TaxID=34765 RepID=A0ABN7SF28_OIKDI|nr:Oidioi.mRNA.OKI2018_I69.XSR.g14526.t1.cds [Oikopleura dioica]
MFSSVSQIGATFRSEWNLAKDKANARVQTSKIKTKEAKNNSSKVKNSSTTTDCSVELQADKYPEDQIQKFLFSVYNRVSAQLEANIRSVNKVNRLTGDRSMLENDISLEYENKPVVTAIGSGATVISVFGDSLCYWNLTRSPVKIDVPDRVVPCPSAPRVLKTCPAYPELLVVGFNNGDVRVLANDDWGICQHCHRSPVRAIDWSKNNAQLVLSADFDSVVGIWRYSKSRHKIELKSKIRTVDNFGCPLAISIENDFVLFAYDTNFLAMFHFPENPLKASKPKLEMKKVFKRGFELPFSAHMSLNLRYLPTIQELAVADGNGIIKLYGPLKDNLKELEKYDSVASIDIFGKIIAFKDDKIDILRY